MEPSKATPEESLMGPYIGWPGVGTGVSSTPESRVQCIPKGAESGDKNVPGVTRVVQEAIRKPCGQAWYHRPLQKYR